MRARILKIPRFLAKQDIQRGPRRGPSIHPMLLPWPSGIHPLSHARAPQIACLEAPPAGIVVTVLSGLAILGRPDSALWALFEDEPELSDSAVSLTSALLRSDGWDIRCEIGDTLAKRLGGTGRVANLGQDVCIGLDLTVAFAQQPGRVLPSGVTRLLRPSKLVKSRGSWDITAVDDGLLPTALEWQLVVGNSGISAGSAELIPAGEVLTFEAEVEADAARGRVAAISGLSNGGGVRFKRGRISVLEEIGMGFSELKVIGTFDAAASRGVRESTAVADSVK